MTKVFTINVDTLDTVVNKNDVKPIYNQGDVNTSILNINITQKEMPYDLTGATVSVYFEKDDSTIVYQDSTTGLTVTDAINGKISITLNTQTLSFPGKVLGAIKITTGTATIETKSFYIYVQKSLTNNNSIKSANYIDSLIGQPNEAEWTATAGQLTYVLPNNQTYDPNSKWLSVYVGGAPIPASQIQKDSQTQFTLLIDPSIVLDGMKVFATWVQSYVPTTSGHHSTHEKGGYDEIDIVNLKNFNEQVETPLAQKAQQSDLNSANANIALKADKSYVDSTISAINASPKGVYATLSALQTAFPSGNSNIYLVTADGKWYYWNGTAWTAGGVYQSTVLADGSITPPKTNFVTPGKNLFNKATVTSGQYVNGGTGTLYSNGNYSVSDYISVTPNTAYYFTGVETAHYAFYDSNKNYIGGSEANTGNPVTSIANANYMRVSVVTINLNISQIELGTVGTAFEAFGYRVSNLIVKTADITDSNVIVQNAQLDFNLKTSSNIFNKNTATQGQQLNGDGSITANVNMFVSDYIPVTSVDFIYAADGDGSTVVRLYDASKNGITTLVPNFQVNQNTPKITLSSYSTVAYIRFSGSLSNLSKVIVAKNPIYKYENYKQIPFASMEHANNNMVNHWKGKNGDSLGDSLTGQGFFQKYVQQYFNLYKFSNHGIPGTKLSGAANGSGDSMWMDSRINALDVDADFMTVLGGQNDGNVTIGALTIQNYDTNTYAGALNVIISKLYYKYQKLSAGYYASSGISYSGITQVTTAKNILIFLCTPFYVPNNVDPTQATNQANAVREIAKLWGLPVMDLGGRSGFNDGVKDVYWAGDRIHPLELGHSDRLAPVMIGEMERSKPIDYTKVFYL